jgi:hypothetical protein
LEQSTQLVIVFNKPLTHIVTTLLKKYSWKTIAGIQCRPINGHDREYGRRRQELLKYHQWNGNWPRKRAGVECLTRVASLWAMYKQPAMRSRANNYHLNFSLPRGIDGAIRLLSHGQRLRKLTRGAAA